MEAAHMAEAFLRRLPGTTLGLCLASLIIVNRPVSQVPVGPVYFLDAVLVATVLLRPIRVARALVRFWPALVLVVLSCGWMLFEAATGNLDALAIRRAATGVYAVVPAVFWTYRREVFVPLARWPAVGSALAFVATIAIGDVSLTTSAVVLLALTIACVRAPAVRHRWLQATISLTGFTLVATAALFPSASLVRTPFAAFFGVLAIAAIRFGVRVQRRRRARRLTPVVGLALAIVAVLAMTTTPVRAGTGTILAAVAGLTNSDVIRGVALALNPERKRERGDSIGTAVERTRFWAGIAQYNATSFSRALVGSGHRMSFFQATRPGEQFFDAELLEPHNSFFGVYYRYGTVGVIALLATIATVVRASTEHRGPSSLAQRAWIVDSLFVAIVYAFFEVVLEVPYGAVVFWSLLVFPAAWGVRQQTSASSHPGLSALQQAKPV